MKMTALLSLFFLFFPFCLAAETRCHSFSMHQAARKGNSVLVKKLLIDNLPIDEKDKEGYSPLFHAISAGKENVVKIFLSKDLALANLNCGINTPPLLAALYGQKKTNIVNILLKNGADPNIKIGSWPILLHVLTKGDRSFAKLLIEHGADIDFRTDDGFSPLFVASFCGHQNLVEYLISQGAITNIASPQGLPIIEYLDLGDKDCLKISKILRKNGAQDTLSPILRALRDGQTGLFEKLIAKITDPDEKMKEHLVFGQTLLHLASSWGRTKAVKFLLSIGADPNILAPNGFNSLNFAARNGHYKVGKALIIKGAKIESNPNDETALCSAVWGAIECRNQLVEKRKITEKSASQRTLNKFADFLKFLIKHGARVKLDSIYQESPLKIAEKNNFRELMNFMEDASKRQ